MLLVLTIESELYTTTFNEVLLHGQAVNATASYRHEEGRLYIKLLQYVLSNLGVDTSVICLGVVCVYQAEATIPRVFIKP